MEPLRSLRAVILSCLCLSSAGCASMFPLNHGGVGQEQKVLPRVVVEAHRAFDAIKIGDSIEEAQAILRRLSPLCCDIPNENLGFGLQSYRFLVEFLPEERSLGVIRFVFVLKNEKIVRIDYFWIEKGSKEEVSKEHYLKELMDQR